MLEKANRLRAKMLPVESEVKAAREPILEPGCPRSMGQITALGSVTPASTLRDGRSEGRPDLLRSAHRLSAGGGVMNAESPGLFLTWVKLPSFAAYHQQVARQARRKGWSFTTYRYHLAEMEMDGRRVREIGRLVKGSPFRKTRRSPCRTHPVSPRRCSENCRYVLKTFSQAGREDPCLQASWQGQEAPGARPVMNSFSKGIGSPSLRHSGWCKPSWQPSGKPWQIRDSSMTLEIDKGIQMVQY